jgi:hypothetical protein
MSTLAQIGAGSYVQLSAHGANSYSNIGSVVSFTSPNQSVSFDDITNLQSPAIGPGIYKEQIPTMVDPGKFSATCIYYAQAAGGYANLVTAFQSLSLYDFKAVIVPTYGSDQTTYQFSGYVSDFPQVKTVSASKHLEFDLNVTISGAVVSTF